MKTKILGILLMIIMLVSIFAFASCADTYEPSPDETNEKEECQHSFDGWYVKEKSTCTTDGEKRRNCINCDYYETEVIKGGHTAVVDEPIEPTCISTGLTEGSHCSVCNEVLVAQEVISKVGHTNSTAVKENNVDPNCENAGYYDSVVYCAICNIELSRENVTVNALGHTEVFDEAVEPTCTDSGLTQGSHCSVCNVTLVAQKVVSALGHTNSTAVRENNVEPDCENTGSYDSVIYCATCNSELSRENVTVDALGHTNSTAVRENNVEPGCENTGSYDSVIYCATCGSELSRENIVVDALGHTEVVDEAVEPTCTTTGLTEGSHCSACDKVFNQQATIDMIDHNYVNYVCSMCGIELTATSDDYFEFVLLSNDTYSVRAKKTSILPNEIIIPKTHNDKAVTQIALSAFSGCSNLTNVVIPDTVTNIGAWSFNDCYNLTSVTIGNGVTIIDGGAFLNCSSLSNILIPNSVTTICSDAFKNCSSLTNVVIPDSVTAIGCGAFNGCIGLVSITLPFVGASKDGDRYTNFGYIFGDYPYYQNSNYVPTSLRKVTITGGNIANYAFSACSNISEIIIGDNVTRIGYCALYNCTNLFNLTIPFVGESISETSNTHFGYIFGANAYSSNSQCVPSRLKVLKITGGNIADYALFGCSSIGSITIGDRVSSIGECAFYECSQLSTIDISDNVITIGSQAFYNCPIVNAKIPASAISIIPKTSLTTITITSGSSIPNNAFSGCSNLTNITISSSITSIGSNAFYNCRKVKDIYITDIETWLNTDFGNLYSYPNYYGALHILDDSGNEIIDIKIPNNLTLIPEFAFCNAINIESITIHSNIIEIGENAFMNCTNLNDVYITDISTWCNISFKSYFSNPLYYATNFYVNNNLITELVIPDNVNSISDYAFYGYASLAKVTIPNSVTSIGNYAFYNCSSLTSVVIPDSVTSIGGSAFSDCSSLTSVVIPDSVTSIGSDAFYSCSSLINVTIGRSVTYIPKSAFANCSGLTHITIPSNITSIHDTAFNGCDSLYVIYNNSKLPMSIGSNKYGSIAKNAKIIKQGSTTYTDNYIYTLTDDGFLFRFYNYKYELLAYIGKEETITLPEKINGEKYEIYCMRGAVNVIIPDSFTTINDYAFEGCTSLTSITIPSSVVSIGNYAFNCCTNLTSITIPDSVTSIGCYVFAHCLNLTSVTIPSSVTSIDEHAFERCLKLTNIILPNSITSIGDYAFKDCISLENVEIPNSVTYIGSSAFEFCVKFSSITIPYNVKKIGPHAFKDCENLEEIILSNTNGWWITTYPYAYEGLNISRSSLSNKNTVLMYFLSSYCDYYWNRT